MTTHRIITRELLRQWDACWNDDQIAERVPLEGVHILRVLDADDVDILDRIWVGVRAIPEREARMLACDWAERACAITGWQDPRSLEAIAVARRYAHGMATELELASARAAAWAEAWAAQAAEVDAAWAAARDAQAAERATWAAEWAAAGAAAWAAEGAAGAVARAADSAAWASARSSAWASARSSAWASAGAAAETRQLTDIRAVCERLERAE